MVPLGVPMAGPEKRSGSLKIWLVLLVAVVALPFCLLSAAVVLRSQEAVRWRCCANQVKGTATPLFWFDQAMARVSGMPSRL